MEFKEYTSLLEIKFDYENALKHKIENIWFIFDKARCASKVIKPLLILRKEGDKLYNDNAIDIYNILKFFPMFVASKDVIKDTMALTKDGNYASFYIHNTTLNTGIKQMYEDYSKYIAPYSELMLGGYSIDGKKKSYSYKYEMEDLDRWNIPYEETKEGLLVEDPDILLTKDKSLCIQMYNAECAYDNLVYLDKNEVLGSIGQFYIYKGNPTYPLSEHLARYKKCDKCGKSYISNYFYPKDEHC